MNYDDEDIDVIVGGFEEWMPIYNLYKKAIEIITEVHANASHDDAERKGDSMISFKHCFDPF